MLRPFRRTQSIVLSSVWKRSTGISSRSSRRSKRHCWSHFIGGQSGRHGVGSGARGDRKFDAEDKRQLESLAGFASAAYQADNFLSLGRSSRPSSRVLRPSSGEPFQSGCGRNSFSASIPLAWLVALPEMCLWPEIHMSGKRVNRAPRVASSDVTRISFAGRDLYDASDPDFGQD